VRPRRTRLKHRLDLEEAAERSLRGETCEEIALALGVSASQISRDLKRKGQEWFDAAWQDLGLLRARELAKLRQLEQSYWRAWATSKGPRETSARRSQGNPPHTTTVTVHSDASEGNPAFLAGVLRCLRQRSRILGLGGKALEQFLAEREELAELEEQMKLAQTYSDAQLVRRLEHTYGPLKVYLGERCPETPGVWWGGGRIFGPDDYPEELRHYLKSKRPPAAEES